MFLDQKAPSTERGRYINKCAGENVTITVTEVQCPKKAGFRRCHKERRGSAMACKMGEQVFICQTREGKEAYQGEGVHYI